VTTTASFDYLKQSRQKIWLIMGVALLLLLSVFFDIATGPGDFSLSQVCQVIFNPDAHGARLNIIIWDIRIPTALMAILVGAMLSAAGAEMQTILNNPLADPFTLGISSAASFGAAIAIVVGVETIPVFGDGLITVSAFSFALATSLFLYLFTRLRGTSSETMVLVGIALLFAFNALLSLLQYTATDAQLSQIVFWMMGSLGRANWMNITVCSVILLCVIPVFVYRGWALTSLRMGDDKAASLGVNVKRLRIEILLGVSLLAATAVSFVGTIGFVGLVGPHIARMIVGENQRFFLPMSIICGALMMSLTSIVSKSITTGVVYPVGIITALIGIPFFISLILTVQRRSWH